MTEKDAYFPQYAGPSHLARATDMMLFRDPMEKPETLDAIERSDAELAVYASGDDQKIINTLRSQSIQTSRDVARARSSIKEYRCLLGIRLAQFPKDMAVPPRPNPTHLTESDLAPCIPLMDENAARDALWPKTSYLDVALRNPAFSYASSKADIIYDNSLLDRNVKILEAGDEDAMLNKIGFVVRGEYLKDTLVRYKLSRCYNDIRLKQLKKKKA